MTQPIFNAARAEHFRHQEVEQAIAERKARIIAAREVVARIEGQLSTAQAELSAAVEADK